jgi:hypothetical protein
LLTTDALTPGFETTRRSSASTPFAKRASIDPLRCPQCGAEMRIVAFITPRAVIDRILEHLRQTRDTARGPPRSPRRAPSRPARHPA